MKILNHGSMNIDHVYSMPHFVCPGETLAATGYERHIGGKGLNQSIALARAGATVCHTGFVGAEGGFLCDYLHENAVDVSRIAEVDTPTGHAIIQVDAHGNNCILLYPGANDVEDSIAWITAFEGFEKGDWLLLQNERAGNRLMIEHAHTLGMTIALNPSPIGPALDDIPWEKVSYLLLNEIEGEALGGSLDVLTARFPHMHIVQTLGADGAVYAHGTERIAKPAQRVPVVDTTAAGDTFTGYFLTGVMQGLPMATAMEWAIQAAALAVTRKGAAESIPQCSEVGR